MKNSIPVFHVSHSLNSAPSSKVRLVRATPEEVSINFRKLAEMFPEDIVRSAKAPFDEEEMEEEVA